MSIKMDGVRDLFISLDLHAPAFCSWHGCTAAVTALPYGLGDEALAPGRAPGGPYGSLAAFAHRNFYAELIARLSTVRDRCARSLGLKAAAIRVFCNSSLPEKHLASRGGLGFIGRNNLLILPGRGSLYVLGGLLLPAGAERHDPPLDRDAEACDGCSLCVEACPGRALGPDGGFFPHRCIQSYTSSLIEMPAELVSVWGDRIYGCQICQQVCPLNADPPRPAVTRLGLLGPTLPLGPLLSLPPEGIKEMVKGSVLDRRWIDPLALKRNAFLAAGADGATAGWAAAFAAPYLRPETPAALREAALHCLTAAGRGGS